MFVGRSVRIPVNNARDPPSGYFPGINYAGQVYAAKRSLGDASILNFLTPKIFFFTQDAISKSVPVY